MQLLTRHDIPDFAAWKTGFDAHAETRAQAGLTLLQMWRSADGPGAVCLFEVADRARAQAWLDTETGLGHPITGQFLRTA